MKVIIDGVTYIPEKQEEKKQGRLSGWVNKKYLSSYTDAILTKERTPSDDTRMIEIRDGEIILDEDTARNKLAKYIHAFQDMQKALHELGFNNRGNTWG